MDSRLGFRSTELAMTPEVAQLNWEGLQRAIRQIYDHESSQLSFEVLYRTAYELCLNRYGELLYNGVHDELSLCCQSIASRLADFTDESLVSSVIAAYADFRISLAMVRDVLMYMDRNFVRPQRKTGVWELGLGVFAVEVLEHARVGSRLVYVFESELDEERRSGSLSVRDVGLKLVSMLQEMSASGVPFLPAGGSKSMSPAPARQASVSAFFTRPSVAASIPPPITPSRPSPFERLFAQPLLRTADAFYRREASESLARFSLSDFLSLAHKRFSQEHYRLSDWRLQSELSDKLNQVLDSAWLGGQGGIALWDLITINSSIDMAPSAPAAVFFFQGANEELRMIFEIFSRTPAAVNSLGNLMTACIQWDCKTVLQNSSSNCSVFVNDLLDVRQRYHIFTSSSFSSHRDLAIRMKQAFECSLSDVKVATSLAQYFDLGLRDGNSEVDLKATVIDGLIGLFRFISDKDVFEAHYRLLLSKRLLEKGEKEGEREIIGRLKGECGALFVSRLEGMLADLQYSEDLDEKWRNNGNSGVTVRVLSAGVWPVAGWGVEVPSFFRKFVDEFSNFYSNQHSGRRLNFLASLGTVELRWRCGSEIPAESGETPKPAHAFYQLSMSTLQAFALVEISSKPQTFSSLQSVLIADGSEEAITELKRHVTSLIVNPKFRLLNSAGDGRSIVSESDLLSINESWEGGKARQMRVPLLKEKTGTEAKSKEELPQAVEEERKFLLDAVLIRVMKSRKVLAFNQLLIESVTLLGGRFNPSVALFKQRIESLTERDYLRKGDGNVLEYLA